MDEDDDGRVPFAWGDMGAIVLAAGVSLLTLWLIGDMLLGGHPLAAFFPKSPEPTVNSAALSEAQWREKKFTTVPGEVVISTSTVAPPRAGDGTFPEIEDWTSLRITLARSVCFGTCPIYSVQISGDGAVVYNGKDCVAQKGERTARIGTNEVARLVQAFRDAKYFSLHDRYTASITDNPTYTTSIRFDGKLKTVEDYAGAMAAMPRAVTDLEIAIDKAAGTERWISGGTRTCDGRPVK